MAATTSPRVRKAVLDDLPAIVDILNHAITSSAANFDLEPYTVDQKRHWFDDLSANCMTTFNLYASSPLLFE